MAKIDVAVTSSKEPRGKRWVEVPEKDLFDITFPTIRVNLTPYGPGKHFVDADIADFVEDRIKTKQLADIRTMRPTQDIVSQSAMNRFGPGAGRGQFSANPDQEMAG